MRYLLPACFRIALLALPVGCATRELAFPPHGDSALAADAPEPPVATVTTSFAADPPVPEDDAAGEAPPRDHAHHHHHGGHHAH